MVFTVNGIVWELKFVKPNSRELIRDNGTRTIGMTNGLTHTIYIANNLQGRMLDKVLSHELTHCLLFSYGIEIDQALEEKLANWISIYGRELVYLLDDLLSILHRGASEWRA